MNLKPASALGTEPVACDFTESVWWVVFCQTVTYVGQCRNPCHYHFLFCFNFNCLCSPFWHLSSAPLLFRACALPSVDGWGEVVAELAECKSAAFLHKREGACHNQNTSTADISFITKALLFFFLGQSRLSALTEKKNLCFPCTAWRWVLETRNSSTR